MNRSSFTALLALALVALVPSAAAQSPLKKFGEVLNSTVAQLGVLGSNTYNAGSFTLLSNLLSNLFGSMMTLSEPYFNSYIGQMLAQNAVYLEQIKQLEAKNAAYNTMSFHLLNSASATLGSLVANIGGTLILYQNEANRELFNLQNDYRTGRAMLDQAAINIPAAADRINGVLTPKLAGLLTKLASTEAQLAKANEVFPVLLTKSDPTELANGIATAGDACGTYNFDLTPFNLSQPPWIFAHAVALADPERLQYDTHYLSITATNVQLKVCRSDGAALNPLNNPFVVELSSYIR